MRVVIRLAPLGVFFLLAYNFAHIDTEKYFDSPGRTVWFGWCVVIAIGFCL